MYFEGNAKLIVLALLVGFFLARSYMTRHYTRFTPRMLIKYVVLIVIMSFYLRGSIDFALLAFPFALQVYVGIPLMIIGFGLFFWAHAHLGINWSPVIEKRFAKTRYLVTTGPYRYIRHPTYTASFVVLVGLFVFSANWVLAGIPFLILVVFYSIKIPREERELVRNFGKKYSDYMKRTSRLMVV